MITSFIGDLLVISNGDIKEGCTTQAIVANSFKFGCPIRAYLSVTMAVQINQPVVVQSDYSQPFTSGTFYHCLGFQQNGMLVHLSFLKL